MENIESTDRRRLIAKEQHHDQGLAGPVGRTLPTLVHRPCGVASRVRKLVAEKTEKWGKLVKFAGRKPS
jgi:hypothetical protein